MRDTDTSHADPLKLMEMKVKRHLKLLVCLWPGKKMGENWVPSVLQAEGCHCD